MITTMSTLQFTITSDNPPHTTAIEFIKAAARKPDVVCNHAACPMTEGVDRRSTEFTITHEDPAFLTQFRGWIFEAMTLIGVEFAD